MIRSSNVLRIFYAVLFTSITAEGKISRTKIDNYQCGGLGFNKRTGN